MVIFDPVKLAGWSSGRWSVAEPERPLSGFGIDTRKLQAGQIFIAIRAEDRDGHDFLGKAKSRGASAAIVEREVPGVDLPQLVVPDAVTGLMDIAGGHRAEFDGYVIGITGSCGKTSTKDVLALLMGSSSTCKTRANLNNRLGLSLTLLGIDPAEHESAVVEAGISEPGEMDDLACTLQPDAAIVTLVGEAHIEGLGTLDAVAREKYRLLESVRPGGFSLFPVECLGYPDFLQESAGHWILCEVDPAPISRDFLHYHLEAAGGFGADRLELRSRYFEPTWFELPLAAFGRGSVRNLSMALGTALRSGIKEDTLQERLFEWTPSPLRGEIRVREGQTFYVDCYNANPVSMQEALDTFTQRFEQQPKLFVLGCMNELGDDSQDLHRRAGSQIQLSAEDGVILCGEQAGALMDGLLGAGADTSAIRIVAQVEDARLQIEAFQGAILLKGSRSYGLETLLPDDETFEERRLAAC